MDSAVTAVDSTVPNCPRVNKIIKMKVDADTDIDDAFVSDVVAMDFMVQSCSDECDDADDCRCRCGVEERDGKGVIEVQ
jgi:hypothetical protein